MKPQEAINILEKYKSLPKSEVVKTAYEMAISALEKQIPKKPNVHGYREGREINTISYTCPACNKHISREDYCKHCGQALFWESEVDTE